MDPSRTITQTHERRSGPGKGQPYLFLTLRCDHPLEGGARFSFQGADQVSVGRGGALQVERQQGETSSIRISLPDGRMSSRHARLQRVLGAWMIEDAGSKNGTFVDGKRVTTSPLADGALVESELFGYRKGAFSGALEDRPGLVRSSEHGTLLLDEIGDLPLAAQAALLRVLQESEVLPVGGTRPVKVDLRVVAATHRDLGALAAQDRFRRDLLARLDGARIMLPALRERREDFGLILSALMEKTGEMARDLIFSADAARALLLHSWPLNVRELEKCLASAVLLARDGRVELEHLRETVFDAPKPVSPPQGVAPEGLREADRRLREQLIELLRANGGNVTAAARTMGKARTQVQRWLRRFEIDPASFIR